MEDVFTSGSCPTGFPSSRGLAQFVWIDALGCCNRTESLLRPRRRALHECGLLQPAGTGSTSVLKGVKQAVTLDTSRMNLKPPVDFRVYKRAQVSTQFANYSKHTLTVLKMMESASLPPCVIMSLRDPAARLASGFRFDEREGSAKLSYPSLHSSKQRSVSDLVNNFRNTTSKVHGFMKNLYYASAGEPKWHGSKKTGSMANPFLVSQAHYLSGWRCDRPELHVVCTDQFENSWLRLLRSFNINASDKLAARHDEYRSRQQHKPTRMRVKENDTLVAEEQLRAWNHQLNARPSHLEMNGDKTRLRNPFRAQNPPEGLSDEQAEFIRRCLFPWDTILHAWACTKLDRNEFTRLRVVNHADLS